MPLMDALRQRRSTREYSDRALDLQTLADLLWAAAGINRPQEGKRTAPSTRNWQAVDVYVCLAEGAYRYDPANHRLEAAAPGDLRDLTGMQDFVATAPVNLVYVADLTRMAGIEEEAQRAYSAADAAFMAENVYLFCASSGLATVVRGSVDGAALTGPLKLKEGQRVVLAQTVGYPAAP